MLELGKQDRFAGRLLRAAGGFNGDRCRVGLIEVVTAAAVMLPSGSKRPAGVGTSSCITQIWHVRFSGMEGMFSVTSITLFSSMAVTCALAPCLAYSPSSGIVRPSWTCRSGRSDWASSTWPVRS